MEGNGGETDLRGAPLVQPEALDRRRDGPLAQLRRRAQQHLRARGPRRNALQRRRRQGRAMKCIQRQPPQRTRQARHAPAGTIGPATRQRCGGAFGAGTSSMDAILPLVMQSITSRSERRPGRAGDWSALSNLARPGSSPTIRILVRPLTALVTIPPNDLTNAFTAALPWSRPTSSPPASGNVPVSTHPIPAMHPFVAALYSELTELLKKCDPNAGGALQSL